MCNLYTYKMSADEMRSLMGHYQLVGDAWADRLRMQNEPVRDVFPNYEAPVVVLRDGRREIETLRWGFATVHGQQGACDQRAQHEEQLLEAVAEEGAALPGAGGGLRRAPTATRRSL